MKKLFIMANWKANMNFYETLKFLEQFNYLMASKKTENEENKKILDNNEYVIASPLISIPAFLAVSIKDLKIGAQNVSEFEPGAYTGDVTAEMLHKSNVKYVIVGHSERRRFHNETDEIVNKKAQRVIANNMTPIICVGENLEEYSQKLTKEIIKKQLDKSLQNLPFEKIIISYEPIWAIGNHAATPEEANEICQFIKKYCKINVEFYMVVALNKAIFTS